MRHNPYLRTSLLSDLVDADPTGRACSLLLRAKHEQMFTTCRYKLVGSPNVLTRHGPGVNSDLVKVFVKDHFGPFNFILSEKDGEDEPCFSGGRHGEQAGPHAGQIDLRVEAAGQYGVRAPQIPFQVRN